MALAKATQAPALSLPLLDGGQFTLSQQLATRPLLLFFFKTTCPVCQLASPFVERLAQSGASVFGICQDLDKEAAAKYCREYRQTFPVMNEQAGYAISNKYRIDVVPTFYVIDTSGKIIKSVECFDKAGLDEIATTLGVSSPFLSSDNVPFFRPG